MLKGNVNSERFESLYGKLLNNELSREEHEEFLSFVTDTQNEDLVRKVLDKNASQYLPGVQMPIQSTPVRRLKSRWGVLGLVASIVLVVGVLGVLWQFVSKGETHSLKYSTTNGQILELLLPDSSLVKLNANSSLTWIDKEDGRKVLLNGEAFFQVRHMEDNSNFTVETKNARILVLGTSFNVNSRVHLDKVFLEEGSIQLENVGPLENDKILLDPGEGAVVQSDELIRMAANVDELRNEVAWKDGLLRFSGVRLTTIIDRLEEIYGTEIRVVDPMVLDTEMEFTLPYSDWDVTGQALALAVGLEVVEMEGYILIQ